jgi:pimeloyl-ACP methyl ester carboxylesterase
MGSGSSRLEVHLLSRTTAKSRADAIDLPFGAVPPGNHLDLDGGGTAFVRIAGARRADTPPMLLLHGLGATGALNWAGCFAPLGRRTQVIAVDHRGHGRGPRVGNRFRLTDCADDAAAVLRTLDTGPAIVVGYSMGGPIAQLLARRHPDVVAGLILSATSRDFRGRVAERMRFAAVGALAAAARFGPTGLAPAFVPVLPGQLRPVGWALSELRRHEPSALVAATAELGRFSSRAWVGEIDVPAAVVVHQRDGLVPPHRQRKLADALPHADLFEVDTDHLGVTRDLRRYLPALLGAHASVARRAAAHRAPARRHVSDITAGSIAS